MGLLLKQLGSQQSDSNNLLYIKLKTLRIWVFQSTSIQRQFKTKWEVDTIFVVNYDVNNKDNEIIMHADKIIQVMKDANSYIRNNHLVNGNSIYSS